MHDTQPADETRGRFRLVFIALLAAATGVAAGLAAYLLYLLIALVTNAVFYQRFGLEIPGLAAHTLGYWIVIAPAAGGFLVSLMVRYGSPRISGSGIPHTIEAILVNRSRIRPRVILLKPVSAALAIGTGGPFGAEGPIVHTGGAIGSAMGQLVKTTAMERRTLLACGAAAGMAATFSTPIAAVIFAIELLLLEFRTRSFIPLVVASTLATSVHYMLMGHGPMFETRSLAFDVPVELPWYVLLGAICGLGGVVLTRTLYGCRDLYARLPVNPFWWPALGGLVLGLVGLLEPRVLGVGYEAISGALTGNLTLVTLVTLLGLKAVVFTIALASGTSGGLLAPILMIGACLGGTFAMAGMALVPALELDPAAYALVAMAALFAAAARTPFTFIVFAFELTRNYDAVLPLMLACVTATLVMLYLSRHSIITEDLARRGIRVSQDIEVDVLHQVAVSEVMDPDPPALPADLPLERLAERLAANDPGLGNRQAWPLLDADGGLAGIISRGDVMAAMEQKTERPATVIEAGSSRLVTAYPDEVLHTAVTRMLSRDIGRILVVDRADRRKLVGYVGRNEILRSRLKRIRDEQETERGWL